MKYRFEIQSLIEVDVEADSKEEARMILVETHRENYADEMMLDCCISDGELIN